MAALTALIDTSVLVGDRPVDVAGGWAVSIVAVGELEAGVLLAEDPEVRAARLSRLTAVLGAAPVIDVDRAAASSYGRLRAVTARLPSNDLWIAATALAHDLILVTCDTRQAALPLVRTELVA